MSEMTRLLVIRRCPFLGQLVGFLVPTEFDVCQNLEEHDFSMLGQFINDLFALRHSFDIIVTMFTSCSIS